MRKCILAAGILLGATGCATSAEREMARINTVSADGEKALDGCLARVQSTSAYAALKDRLALGREDSLAEQAATAKPSTSEVQALYEYHAANTLCRKGALEAAANMSLSLVPVLTGALPGRMLSWSIS